MSTSSKRTPILEEHISKDAEIMTDKWKGYEPLKKDYSINQELSS